jgi:hypothetical protein
MIDHRVKWRYNRIDAGLCGYCGKQPLALNQKTRQLAQRCARCLERMRRRMQVRRVA